MIPKIREAPTLFKRLKNIAPVRLVVGSFFLIIVLGTFLLTLPLSSRAGHPTPLIDALFTATSATCVTGLVVADTFTHWSTFGQVVILMLIQIGGLGVVTFTTGFTLLLRRKIGLRDLQLAKENTAGNTMHVYHLVKMILAFTFLAELAGAAFLMLRFIPRYGGQGIWISVFLAVSSYCNAGFDILGFEAPDMSLINYAGDPLVCLPIAGLIFLGGLGFIVISDLYYSQVRPRLTGKPRGHVNLQTSIVLWMSLLLVGIGTILFFAFEFNNTLRDMNFFTKLQTSFFQSVSARTAGFASVPIGAEHDTTKIFTVLLMFIGASPAGTGGGIKTTTFIVLIATVVSVVRGSDETVVRNRRIDKSIVYRSLAIFFFAVMVILLASGVILSTENAMPISAVDALFEATSAFATVGLTTGVTPFLGIASKIVLIITMFIGRVGPVSLVIAIVIRRGKHSGAVLPEGKLIVG